MANQYKKTIILGLDYSEFSGGITECNRKMGLLDAEMKYASERAKAFGDETDQLRIKQEGLTQKIELQKKIVEQQAQAYDKAMTKYNGTGKEVDRLDKSLLSARTTLQRYENELKDTTKQLDKMEKETEDAGKEGKSFGDTIREIAKTIDADTSPMVEALASKFDGLNDKVAKAAFGAGALVNAFSVLTSETIEHGKVIYDTSQAMGMTTTEYQIWDYILKTVGYDAESASGDLAALAEKARDAASGGEDSAKIFRILGVQLKDNEGNLKTQGELFGEVVQGLMNMTDETDRNAIASDLLSTTGEKLVPILNMTAEEFKGLVREAVKTGSVLDEDVIENAKRTSREMQQMESRFEAVKYKLGSALLPILEDFVGFLNDIPTPALETGLAIGGIVSALGGVADIALGFMGMSALISGGLGAIGAGGATATAGVGPLLLTLLAIAAAIALIVGVASGIGAAMDEVKAEGNAVINAYKPPDMPKYNARGTEFFEGGETWVGEEGAELVQLPRGSRILSHKDSMKAARRSGGNIYVFNIQADKVKDFNHLVKLAEEERIAFRTGRVRV